MVGAGTKRVAIVTGGGTGLGRGAAVALAREGYEVAVLGRRLDKLQPKPGDVGIHPFQCDVADKGQVDRTVGRIAKQFGRIDLLVNNAGLVRMVKLEAITPEHVAETFGANMYGTINMTIACIPALRASSGSIINVSSSIAHQVSDKGVSIYGATKGAVEVFSRISAKELAPAIRVNCISPGFMRSDVYFAAGANEQEYETLIQKWKAYPRGRVGEPEDFGEMVVFLASPEKAGWITGTIMILDGGRSLL